MAKLKVYEIEAIVKTIVDKINEHNKSKIVGPSTKEINSLKHKRDLYKKARAEYDNALEKFSEKYPKHEIITRNSGEDVFEVNICSHRIQVEWDVRENIKNQIVMSQITGSDVEKLINAIVEKYTK